jgi:hypothetical protein
MNDLRDIFGGGFFSNFGHGEIENCIENHLTRTLGRPRASYISERVEVTQLFITRDRSG